MSAFDEGRGDVDDGVSVETLYNRALALKQAARWQDALLEFGRVESRLHEASGDRHDLGRQTLVMRIACLEELNQSEATVVACEQGQDGGTSGGRIAYGIVPDGNPTATIITSGGRHVRTQVVANVYYATGLHGDRGIILRHP